MKLQRVAFTCCYAALAVALMILVIVPVCALHCPKFLLFPIDNAAGGLGAVQVRCEMQ